VGDDTGVDHRRHGVRHTVGFPTEVVQLLLRRRRPEARQEALWVRDVRYDIRRDRVRIQQNAIESQAMF
jgi:hypothetical protein